MPIISNNFSIFFPQSIPFQPQVFYTPPLANGSAYTYPAQFRPYIARISATALGVNSFQLNTPVQFYML